jgi:hypothetical protein
VPSFTIAAAVRPRRRSKPMAPVPTTLAIRPMASAVWRYRRFSKLTSRESPARATPRFSSPSWPIFARASAKSIVRPSDAAPLIVVFTGSGDDLLGARDALDTESEAVARDALFAAVSAADAGPAKTITARRRAAR